MPLPSPTRAIATLLIAVALTGFISTASATQTDLSPVDCGTSDAPPVIASAEPVDAAVTTSVGPEGITLTMPDGAQHQLPSGRLSLEPGIAMVLADNGTRTILSAATGEQWTVAPVAFGDAPIDIATTTSPVVLAPPWVAVPIADDGLDWQIIDPRTGATRTTSDILGAQFPVATDAYPVSMPETDTSLAAIRFSQANQLPEDGVVQNIGATLVIPGTLDTATFIDVADPITPFTDADPIRYTGMTSVVSDAAGQRLAWTAPDATGEGTALQIASVDALDQRQTLATSSADGYIVPLLFTADGDALLALRDGQPIRISISTGTEEVLEIDGFSAQSIRLVNPADGTILFDAGNAGSPEVTLWSAATDAVTPLPELNTANSIFPLEGWTYAGAIMSQAGSPTLVDTRTGEIIATPETTTTGIATMTVAGAYRDGIFVNSQGENLLVQHGERSEAWTIPLPDDIAPGLSARVSISPSGTCLLLSTHAGEEITPTRSWLAPLEPDAAWTETTDPVIDWWPLDA